jgi:hypothetical protein
MATTLLVISTVTTLTVDIIVIICYHGYNILVVALMSLPSNMFVHPSVLIASCRKPKSMNFGWLRMPYCSYLIKICPMFLELKHADGQPDEHDQPYI